MSHELRTPLNSIILLSSLLAKDTKDNLSKQDIQKAKVIHESGNELLRLINDILDLSKIEAGKMELIIDKIYSDELAYHYDELFTHAALEKNLEFKVIDNIKGIFYNDKNRLGQVIRNLISNALKFTKQGSVILSFNKDKIKELPIIITVKDTGIGIPKEKQDVIFKAFMQADGSTSREYGGTGLGLSITKELVKLMKGKITLESEVGKGSSFVIELPDLEDEYKQNTTNMQVVDESQNLPYEKVLSQYEKQQEQEEQKQKQQKEQQNKQHQNQEQQQIKEISNNDNININNDILIKYNKANLDILRNKKVLIVDDDIKNIFVLTSALQEHDMDVVHAKNGQEALGILEDDIVNVVLMDIMMPVMNGYEAIKQIRLDKKTKDIPIIVVSAKAMQEDKEKAFEQGANEYLTKPVQIDILSKVIATLIDQQKDKNDSSN
jgi:two-component system chemotaxis sensor kinase CheA